MVDELADDARPLVARQLLADAEDGELVVVPLEDLLGGVAAQHVDDVADSEPLAGAHNRGERLLRVDGRVVELRRVEAHVAVAAVALERLAEVAEQHAAPARGRLGEGDHRLELVQLDADLLGVAAVLDERARRHHVLQAEEHSASAGRPSRPARPVSW